MTDSKSESGDEVTVVVQPGAAEPYGNGVSVYHLICDVLGLPKVQAAPEPGRDDGRPLAQQNHQGAVVSPPQRGAPGPAAVGV